MLDALPEEVQTAIAGVVSLVLLAVLGLIAQAVRVGVRLGSEWLDGLSRDRRWNAAIGRLTKAAEAAVDSVEQTMAGELRKLEPAGVFSREQALRLAGEARTKALQHFGPETWAGVMSDLELSDERVRLVLADLIEAAVRRRKSTAAIELTSDPTIPGRFGVALEVPAASSAPGPDDSTVREIIAPEDSTARLR